MPLSNEAFNTYMHGVKYEAFWPKLNKQERKHLDDIVTGRMALSNTDDNTTDSNNTDQQTH